MSEVFTLKRQVEFNHCDPAGIVFYPRYFEMISAVQERFFADALGASWDHLIQQGIGTPMGDIQVRFSAPSRLGDWLSFALRVQRIGRASATLVIACTEGDELRFTCRATIVQATVPKGRSLPWSDSVRAKMTKYLMTSQEERKTRA
ncbi:acyl-CoA thioesterase [Celeribacter sp. ULVN23_4]